MSIDSYPYSSHNMPLELEEEAPPELMNKLKKLFNAGIFSFEEFEYLTKDFGSYQIEEPPDPVDNQKVM